MAVFEGSAGVSRGGRGVGGRRIATEKVKRRIL
jgi:hypothetical protein